MTVMLNFAIDTLSPLILFRLERFICCRFLITGYHYFVFKRILTILGEGGWGTL